MSDLQAYILKRKQSDSDFAAEYEAGYQQFRIGVMLKLAREDAGLTQEEVAKKLNTKKSATGPIFMLNMVNMKSFLI